MASYSNVCWILETSVPYVNKEEACELEKERGHHMLVLVRVAAAPTEAGAFLFLGRLECTQNHIEGMLDNKQHSMIHPINIHLVLFQIASKIQETTKNTSDRFGCVWIIAYTKSGAKTHRMCCTLAQTR